MCTSGSVVEYRLAKARVAGSNPVSCSFKKDGNVDSHEQRAKWLLTDIWRLPRGSKIPLLCSGVFDLQRFLFCASKLENGLNCILKRNVFLLGVSDMRFSSFFT